MLFLPGLEASRLYKPDYSGGVDNLWEPFGDGDAANLSMNLSGTSVRDDVYTRDVIGVAYMPSFGNVYTSFISSMNEMEKM